MEEAEKEALAEELRVEFNQTVQECIPVDTPNEYREQTIRLVEKIVIRGMCLSGKAIEERGAEHVKTFIADHVFDRSIGDLLSRVEEVLDSLNPNKEEGE